MQTPTHSATPSDKPGPLEISSGYFAELTQASNIDKLHQRISDIVKRIGFSDYAYIQLLRSNMPQPALCTLPSGLLQTYFDSQLYLHDLTLKKAASSGEAFFYSTIQDYLSDAPFSNLMTQCMETLYSLHKSYGYYDYYYVTSRSDKSPAMLSISKHGLSSGDFQQQIKGCESTLTLLFDTITHTLATQFPELVYKKQPGITLNPKPLQVLDTLANCDLKIGQVADKLSISTVTASQYLKKARLALGTRTNYAAIKRAVLENMIEFRPVPDDALKIRDDIR